jgi:hypothetical protein
MERHMPKSSDETALSNSYSSDLKSPSIIAGKQPNSKITSTNKQTMSKTRLNYLQGSIVDGECS